jgi:carboxymethylenebutenolidase
MKLTRFFFLIAALFISASAFAQEWAKQRLENSPRHNEWVYINRGGRKIHSFVAYPERKDKALAVVLIHENMGLTDWVRNVADQVAAAGYIAIAPDLLSEMGPDKGGTKEFASMDDAREAIYKLPKSQVMADLNAVADYVQKLPAATGKVAVAGFCWGGGESFVFANNRPSLAAAFVFYGSGPDLPTGVNHISAPVYGFYGGNDNRVDATVPKSAAVMEKEGKKFEPVTYEGAGHGFMRAGEQPDPQPANKKARDEAWKRWKEILAGL